MQIKIIIITYEKIKSRFYLPLLMPLLCDSSGGTHEEGKIKSRFSYSNVITRIYFL